MAQLFLTNTQEENVIKAIRKAEKNTSGEIRVHIEQHTEKPTLERAKEVFLYLKMDQTEKRNAVLFYVGVASKQFAILGDKGINRRVPDDFWVEEKKLVTKLFSAGQYEKALVKGITKVGEKLKQFFPFRENDTNELTDKISKKL